MTAHTIREITEYQDKVLEILETFDYPALVIEYETMDVSQSLVGTILTNYIMGISPMMTAIIIWSLTLNYQVIPDTQKMVKH